MDIGWKICLFDVFLDGFGVGPCFLDDLEWILMVFGRMLRDGFWMVF